MYEPNEKTMQAVIAEGLEIDEAFGAARAWVYLMHHGFSREAVATMLSVAAQRRSRPGERNSTADES